MSIKSKLQASVDWESVEIDTKADLIKKDKRHLWSIEEIYTFLKALQKEGWSDRIELTDEEFEKLLQREDIKQNLAKKCQTLKDFKIQFSEIIKYRGIHPSESLPVKNMYHVKITDEEKKILKEALSVIPDGTSNRFTEILKIYDFHPARTTTDLRYVVRNNKKREIEKKRKRIEQERDVKRKMKPQKRRKKDDKIDIS